MSKHIQAYFRTEDDAEGARTRLIGYSLENVEVGRLQESISSNREILIPIAPVGNSAGMYAGGAQTAGGGSSVYTTQGAIPLNNVRDSDTEAQRDRREDHPEDDDIELGTYPLLNDEDYEDLQYVLSARVQDQQCDEIVQKLRAEGGYVELLD